MFARLQQFVRRDRASLSRRLLRDSRGATALEFALVAVPLVALLLAIVETALISFSQQALETAAETSARTIMTGSAQTSAMTRQQFHDAACSTLPSYFNCAKLIVDVQSASSFAATNMATPTITYDSSGYPISAYSLGNAGDIVIVRLIYMWPVTTAALGLNLAAPGQNTHLLIGVNVAKTEAYTS